METSAGGQNTVITLIDYQGATLGEEEGEGH